MKQAGVLILVLAAGVAGWFFLSPLFIDKQVDESFDFVLDNGGIDLDAVRAMPDKKRQQMRQQIMAAAADTTDSASTEPMPASTPETIAQGRFVDADAIHKGSGKATLYALPGGDHLVRFDDFRTTNGPALVVYLAKHPSPTQASDVTDGGYVRLGELKGNVGNQNYPVPTGTDISEYKSVVIWCELFGVLFSPAALAST